MIDRNSNVLTKDSSVVIYITLKDQENIQIPLTTSDRFSVQIKPPYSSSGSAPDTVGVTGPIIIYGNNSGSSGASFFYFTYVASQLGDYKYKVQYDAARTGSYELIGPLIKTATVGSFRVVDDDF